ncbi:MAG: histidine kinase dimerization/phospho-acceptor domain-containing protein [Planctomycetaceae bacterium]
MLLLDVVLPDGTGLDLLAELRESRPRQPVILLTARGAENDRVEDSSAEPTTMSSNRLAFASCSPGWKRCFVAAHRRRRRRQPSTCRAEARSKSRHPRSSGRTRHPHRLSQRELQLVQYLATHCERVVTRDELLRDEPRYPRRLNADDRHAHRPPARETARRFGRSKSSSRFAVAVTCGDRSREFPVAAAPSPDCRTTCDAIHRATLRSLDRSTLAHGENQSLMLRRPAHIWLAFAMMLTIVALGFAWLSRHVLDLDYQERAMRLHAEREERISLALWRMESVAMPIIAAEAARPHFVYESFHAVGDDGGLDRIPSPLLQQPSKYVMLNFQLSPGNELFSPQCPSSDDVDLALRNGLTPESLSTNCARAESLESHLRLDQLYRCLPGLPAIDGADVPPSNESSLEQQTATGDAYVSSNSVLPDEQQQEQTLTQTIPVFQSRGAGDYVNRAGKLNQLAEQSARSQRGNFEAAWEGAFAPSSVREGASRPLWVDDKLLVARRIERNGQESVQGCWLDWDRLEADLQRELSELPPEASLRKLGPDDPAAPGRSLASLPIELVVPELKIDRWSGTPTQIALAIAWGGFLLAAVAAGGLLQGVMSLSERRAAFVSAVTHELRTPLTTFQLYTEMLAGDMVTDEQQRHEYVDTLHRESGRLGHLIENVLAYSRLERHSTPPASEVVTIAAVLDRALGALQARAEQAGMTIELRPDDEAAAATVKLDAIIVEQALVNLVDNSCKYAASSEDRTVVIESVIVGTVVHLHVTDAGPGLSTDARRRLFRPFCKSDVEAARSAPGLGLGLAISRELLRSQGADLLFDRQRTHGARFTIELPRHQPTQPA